MTYKEKEIANILYAKIGLKSTCELETDGERQLVWKALRALEEKEKYCWHDLRKNRNDIPDAFEYIMFTDGKKLFLGKTVNRVCGVAVRTELYSANYYKSNEEYICDSDIVAWKYVKMEEPDEKTDD